MAPGGSRKAHSKSRNGCGQCKKRRRKCDEKPPTCGNCQRLGIVCDYAALSAAVQLISYRTFTSDVYAAGYLGDPILFPTLNQADTALLRYYASRTSLSLSGVNTRAIWQLEAPEAAKSYSFTLHGLLALSALHGCYIYSGSGDRISDQHAWIAAQHHEKALALFHSNVTEVNADNGSAVAIFSLFNMFFAFGVPPSRGFAGVSDPISEIVKVFGIVRGAWKALRPQLHTLARGALQPLVKVSNVSRGELPMNGESLELLRAIDIYIQESDEPEEDKAAYRESLSILLGFFWSLPDVSPLSIIIGWPTCFSDHFYTLLTEKRTLALVFLSYWFSPVTRAPMLWLDAWADRVIIAIWNLVDNRARSFLKIPGQSAGIIPREMHDDSCRCINCYLEERVPDFSWKSRATPLQPTKFDKH